MCRIRMRMRSDGHEYNYGANEREVGFSFSTSCVKSDKSVTRAFRRRFNIFLGPRLADGQNRLLSNPHVCMCAAG